MEYGSFYVLFDCDRHLFITPFGGRTTSISMTEHYNSFEEASKKAEEITFCKCEVKRAKIILED